MAHINRQSITNRSSISQSRSTLGRLLNSNGARERAAAGRGWRWGGAGAGAHLLRRLSRLEVAHPLRLPIRLPLPLEPRASRRRSCGTPRRRGDVAAPHDRAEPPTWGDRGRGGGRPGGQGHGHGCAWACRGGHGRAWACRGGHGCAWACTGVRGYAGGEVQGRGWMRASHPSGVGREASPAPASRRSAW